MFLFFSVSGVLNIRPHKKTPRVVNFCHRLESSHIARPYLHFWNKTQTQKKEVYFFSSPSPKSSSIRKASKTPKKAKIKWTIRDKKDHQNVVLDFLFWRWKVIKIETETFSPSTTQKVNLSKCEQRMFVLVSVTHTFFALPQDAEPT